MKQHQEDFLHGIAFKLTESIITPPKLNDYTDHELIYCANTLNQLTGIFMREIHERLHKETDY